MAIPHSENKDSGSLEKRETCVLESCTGIWKEEQLKRKPSTGSGFKSVLLVISYSVQGQSEYHGSGISLGYSAKIHCAAGDFLECTRMGQNTTWVQGLPLGYSA